jgi:hypothetical protein
MKRDLSVLMSSYTKERNRAGPLGAAPSDRIGPVVTQLLAHLDDLQANQERFRNALDKRDTRRSAEVAVGVRESVSQRSQQPGCGLLPGSTPTAGSTPKPLLS